MNEGLFGWRWGIQAPLCQTGLLLSEVLTDAVCSGSEGLQQMFTLSEIRCADLKTRFLSHLARSSLLHVFVLLAVLFPVCLRK